MIKKGDKIVNTRTGQTMIFLQTGHETNGEVLEIENFQKPSLEREAVHVHPYQKSSFEVITGEVHIWIDGQESVLKPGEEKIIPAGVPHLFWIGGEEEAHFYSRFWPALNIAEFFDTYFGLARDGKLNKYGITNIFHTALISLNYKNVIRLTSPPWAVQLLLYYMLAPIGKILGFNGDYKSKNP